MIYRSVLDEILGCAHRAHPRECCGILFGEGTQITCAAPAANVHLQPETHFEIEPQALIDAHRGARNGGAQVIGYYHSHPGGLAEPSATDAERAAHDGSIWAIIADGEVTFWRDGEGEFEPLPYRIVDR